MAGFFKKLADRFRPSPIEQLKQSVAAKKKMRERMVDVPHTQQPEPKRRQVEDVRISQLTNNEPVHIVSSGNVVWDRWHADINNTATCITYHDPWKIWHSGGTGTAGVTDDIWRVWTTDNSTVTTNQVVVNGRWESWVDEVERFKPIRAESARQKRLREKEEAEFKARQAAELARYREEQRAAENRRKAADDRAMGLLVSMLTKEQQADLKNHKHFFVKALSGRLYRIDQGSHGNVKVIDPVSRKVIERLCIQPDGVPAGDSMLMQKILIETAETAFRIHANITLEDGKVIYGDSSPLTGDKLAQIIPLRKVA